MGMEFQRTDRDRAYYRHHRIRVINRKKKIARQIGWHVRRGQYGRLAKGKIHCSCGMCSEKTREIGYPISEQARIEAFMEQIREYFTLSSSDNMS